MASFVSAVNTWFLSLPGAYNRRHRAIRYSRSGVFTRQWYHRPKRCSILLPAGCVASTPDDHSITGCYFPQSACVATAGISIEGRERYFQTGRHSKNTGMEGMGLVMPFLTSSHKRLPSSSAHIAQAGSPALPSFIHRQQGNRPQRLYKRLCRRSCCTATGLFLFSHIHNQILPVGVAIRWR